FHDDAVLEGARFGLVGIAYQVMSLTAGDLGIQRLSFLSGWEGRAAATLQAGLEQFAQHTFRAKIKGGVQGLVATKITVIVDIGGVDSADPAEEAQLWLAGLR